MLLQVYFCQYIEKQVTCCTAEVKKEQARDDPERRMVVDVHVFVLLQEMVKIGATDNEDAQSPNGVGLYAVLREVAMDPLENIEAGEHGHEQSDPWPHPEVIPAQAVQHKILEAHFHRQVNIVQPVIGPVLYKIYIAEGFHHHSKQHEPLEKAPFAIILVP